MAGDDILHVNVEDTNKVNLMYLMKAELRILFLHKSIGVASFAFPVFSVLFAIIYIYDKPSFSDLIFTDYQYVDLAASTGSAFLLYLVPFISGLGWARIAVMEMDIQFFPLLTLVGKSCVSRAC